MSDIQEKIDELMTPVELANELEMNAFFTQGQAEAIVAEVYQPLLEIIKLLTEGKTSEYDRCMAENEALKAENEKLKSESEWIDIKDDLPSYGTPVMICTSVVQHIVYCMDGPGDDSDTTAPWFCAYHFDHENELVIPYQKVKKWKYVDDLMVQ